MHWIQLDDYLIDLKQVNQIVKHAHSGPALTLMFSEAQSVAVTIRYGSLEERDLAFDNIRKSLDLAPKTTKSFRD